jgi:hypothetical protein
LNNKEVHCLRLYARKWQDYLKISSKKAKVVAFKCSLIRTKIIIENKISSYHK